MRRLFGEWLKLVQVCVDGGIICDCKACFLGFLFSLLADEFLDGPDEWVENPPFDFLEDIADGSFIV